MFALKGLDDERFDFGDIDRLALFERGEDRDMAIEPDGKGLDYGLLDGEDMIFQPGRQRQLIALVEQLAPEAEFAFENVLRCEFG